MIDWMVLSDVARAMSAAEWILLGLLATLPAIRSCTKRARRHDLLKAVVLGNVISTVSFNARWLFFRSTLKAMRPEELSTMTALYAMSFAVAFAFILTMGRYSDTR